MIRTATATALALLLAAPAMSWTTRRTVANLPGSPPAGDLVVVVDGSTASDCTVGGGAFAVVCVYDGAAWSAAGGAGTDDQVAAEVPITDGGGFFIGTEVEAALQEIGPTMTDARAPTGAAGGDLQGTYPAPTLGLDVVALDELNACTAAGNFIVEYSTGIPACIPTPVGGGGAHNLLSSTHSDTAAASPVRGDLIVANAGPTWARVPVGAVGTYWRSDGTDPGYAALSIADDPGPALGADLNLAGFSLVDANGNSYFDFVSVPSAVNRIEVVHGATGEPVRLRAVGPDPDIDFVIEPQGNGSVSFGTSSLPTVTFPDSDAAVPGSYGEIEGNLATVTAGLEDMDFTWRTWIAGVPQDVLTIRATATHRWDAHGQAIRLGDAVNYFEVGNDGVVSFGGTGGFGSSITEPDIPASIARDSELHGDGANCPAGQYPLGVDASGAVQGCTVDATSSFTPNADPGVDHSGYVAGHGDGTDCPAGQYARGVDAAGNAQGCTTAGGGGGGTDKRLRLMADDSLPGSSGLSGFTSSGNLMVNNKFQGSVLRLQEHASTDACVHLEALIPSDFASNPRVEVVWTSGTADSPLLAGMQFEFASMGGDDANNFDAAAGEEIINTTDTAPTVAWRRQVKTFALNASFIAAGDSFRAIFCKDASADTTAGNMVVSQIHLLYDS